MYKIIVYGGAFNPPHAGHVDVMERLSKQGRRIHVVPSFRHAFGKDMAPFDLRLQWLDKISTRLSSQGYLVQADDCERIIGTQKDGPIYSWDMLNHIAHREGLDTREIGFVVGEDNAQVVNGYYRACELLDRFPLVVAKEHIHLHSTDIRNALAEGKHIDPSWLASGLSSADYSYFKQGVSA